jgi:hypothetical protein
MADLNQRVMRIKAGLSSEINHKLILYLIDNYTGHGPICCFYICKAREIPKEMMLENFKNHTSSDEDEVIGCSRGCLSVGGVNSKDVKRFGELYAEKLCKECVEEARRFRKDGAKTRIFNG